MGTCRVVCAWKWTCERPHAAERTRGHGSNDAAQWAQRGVETHRVGVGHIHVLEDLQEGRLLDHRHPVGFGAPFTPGFPRHRLEQVEVRHNDSNGCHTLPVYSVLVELGRRVLVLRFWF